MLGRMRFSTATTIVHYEHLCKTIFSSQKQGDERPTKASYEEVLERIVAAAKLGRHVQDAANDTDKGLAFATCVPQDNPEKIVLIRTYDRLREDLPSSVEIWEAIRATTASPQTFAPITLTLSGQRDKYMEDVLGKSNIAHLLLEEAWSRFGGERQLGCILSLGAGQKQGDMKTIASVFISPLSAYMKSSKDSTLGEVGVLFQDFPGAYRRLDFTSTVRGVGLIPSVKPQKVRVAAEQWIRERDVSQEVDQMVHMLQHKRASGLSIEAACQSSRRVLVVVCANMSQMRQHRKVCRQRHHQAISSQAACRYSKTWIDSSQDGRKGRPPDGNSSWLEWAVLAKRRLLLNFRQIRPIGWFTLITCWSGLILTCIVL